MRTSDRVVEFVLDQLIVFFTLRRRFEGCISAYTQRLREEGAGVPISLPTRAAGSVRVLIRRLRIVILRLGAVGSLVRWLLRVPVYTRQYALLRPRPHGATRLDVVVATSGVRLHSDSVDTREYFVALTKPFSETYDPGVAADIASAPRLLISDVILHSQLWPRRHACWADNVFILDSGFALYVGLRAACTLRAPVLVGLVRRIRDYRRRRGIKDTTVLGTIRELLAAGLLMEGYRRALPVNPFRAYFLTSNSFATEILRFVTFMEPKCQAICEVSHGIPTIFWEQYVAEMLAVAEASDVAEKHSSVNQLPDLPMFGVFVSDVRVPASAAINTYLNRYWIQRGEVDTDFFIERELQRLLGGRKVSDRTLVVTFVGGNSQYRDPYESEVLLVERLMMHVTLSVLDRLKQSYVLIYTPHPCYGMEPFLADPFFAETGVLLFPDTVLTWLVCDVAVGLLSSAIWEAAYFGAHSFTPLVPADQMYPRVLIDMLHHPAAAGGSGLTDALTAFLEQYAVRHESCDLVARAKARARRSRGIEVSTLVAAR
jgi:hypothetical protein